MLEAPTLEYADKSTEHPQKGAWDLRNKRFKAAAAFGPYAIAAFGNERAMGQQLEVCCCCEVTQSSERQLVSHGLALQACSSRENRYLSHHALSGTPRSRESVRASHT